jgi:hypothetical protein
MLCVPHRYNSAWQLLGVRYRLLSSIDVPPQTHAYLQMPLLVIRKYCLQKSKPKGAVNVVDVGSRYPVMPSRFLCAGISIKRTPRLPVFLWPLVWA